MTRKILNYDEKYSITVNTFAMGNKGEGVQITCKGPGSHYIQMTRKEAIRVLPIIVRMLKKQVREDEIDPPWWQKIQKKKVTNGAFREVSYGSRR